MFSTYLLCWSSHHHLFPKQHRLQGAKRLSHVCCQVFHSSRYIWKHKVWSRTSACDSVSLTHSMMGVIDTAAVHEHMLKTVEQNHGPEVLRLYSLLLWLDHLLSLKFWLLSMLWPDILYLDSPTCRSDATITFYMEPMAGVLLRAGVSHRTLPHDCFQKEGHLQQNAKLELSDASWLFPWPDEFMNGAAGKRRKRHASGLVKNCAG